MANFVEKWLTESATLPTGWTQRWESTNNSQAVPSTGGKLIWTKTGAVNRSGISFDAADNIADVEVLSLMQGSDFATAAPGILSAGLFCRGATAAAASKSSYILIIRNSAASSQIELAKYVSGSFTSLGTLVMGITPAYEYYFNSNYLVFMRLSAIGDAIKGKVWRYGEIEPDWQVSATDNSITAGGWNGIFTFGSPNVLDVYPVGVGTVGDKAHLWKYHGNVKNSAGANAERRISLLHEDPLAIVDTVDSDAITGNYVLSTPFDAPHIIVADGEAGKNVIAYGSVDPV